jgi:hypothetical protein
MCKQEDLEEVSTNLLHILDLSLELRNMINIQIPNHE